MAHSALAEVSGSGEFKRTAAGYRSMIEPGSTEFPPVAGRYHLYISYACPWANRCLLVRDLKGLQDVIGLSVVHPTWQRTRPEDPEDQHTGWIFRSPDDPPLASSTGHGSFAVDGLVPDDVNGARCVRDLYEMAGDTLGKYSVPVLWDKEKRTIVSNESSEIVRMFNTSFNSLAGNPDLDLYPKELRPAIDEANEWIYPQINNGVYRCGFATSQEAYDTASEELFQALERCEEIFSKQRYIAGDQITEADIRLFMTLVRFDEVYVVYFKTSVRTLREFPNILNYCREVYQWPGVPETISMEHIKTHYFTSHPHLNYYAIIPRSSGTIERLSEPHNRESIESRGSFSAAGGA